MINLPHPNMLGIRGTVTVIRGKLDKPVESGARLSVSQTSDGVACVDHHQENRYLHNRIDEYILQFIGLRRRVDDENLIRACRPTYVLKTIKVRVVPKNQIVTCIL
jgi:hypothetical protein